MEHATKDTDCFVCASLSEHIGGLGNASTEQFLQDLRCSIGAIIRHVFVRLIYILEPKKKTHEIHDVPGVCGCLTYTGFFGEDTLQNKGLAQRGKGLASDSWETPPWLFKALDAEFGFTFDAAASEANHLCKRWSPNINEIRPQNEDRIFCNPPYSDIDLFVEHALYWHGLTVMVLPAFVDKDWYRRLFESSRVEWRPFRQRVRFYENGKPGGSPFFGTVVAVVRPR